jgi:hypothetical protein
LGIGSAWSWKWGHAIATGGGPQSTQHSPIKPPGALASIINDASNNASNNISSITIGHNDDLSNPSNNSDAKAYSNQIEIVVSERKSSPETIVESQNSKDNNLEVKNRTNSPVLQLIADSEDELAKPSVDCSKNRPFDNGSFIDWYLAPDFRYI